METKKLPQIADLYKDTKMAIKQNELNVLLNHPPKKEWLKDHPLATKVKYIPIGRIEWLLTMVFQKWRREIISVQLIAHSVQVTVRLHVKDPLTGEWDWQDGVGAAPLQMDAGATGANWDKIKNNAVMLAVPSAATYAVKDAAENFGKLFGKDINRKDVIIYERSEALPKKQIIKEVSDMVDMIQDHDFKVEIIDKITEAEAKGEDDIAFYESLKHLINGR